MGPYATQYTPPAMRQKILMLGPPGSGKGTYGKLLSKILGLNHVSAGGKVVCAHIITSSHSYFKLVMYFISCTFGGLDE